jgi:hypothetical protein
VTPNAETEAVIRRDERRRIGDLLDHYGPFIQAPNGPAVHNLQYVIDTLRRGDPLPPIDRSET